MEKTVEITDVRITLAPEGEKSKVVAYANCCFDQSFIVREMKIIDSSRGLFVAMPSRKIMDRCPHCAGKNPLTANYCNRCGKELQSDRAWEDCDTPRLYVDCCHPSTDVFRGKLQDVVLDAFEYEEQQKHGAEK